MIKKEKQQMIDVIRYWHTVTDTDVQLRHWAKHLSSQDYLELGRDPRLVHHIEADLTNISLQLRNLNDYFDLRKVALNDANKYYALLRQLDLTLQFVQAVRRQSFGSVANTQKCVDQLHLCVEGIAEMSQVFPFAPFPIQQ